VSITATLAALTANGLGLKGKLDNATDAQKELTNITAAIATVAGDRGTIGATENQLTASQGVASTEATNLTSAENDIQNADIGKTVASMTQYNVLEQTGMAALSQSNQVQQSVLKLLQ
jgi:flagellin